MFLHDFQYDLNGVNGLSKKGIDRLNSLQITNIKELIEHFLKNMKIDKIYKLFPTPWKLETANL